MISILVRYRLIDIEKRNYYILKGVSGFLKLRGGGQVVIRLDAFYSAKKWCKDYQI